jgi:hypothetical protein
MRPVSFEFGITESKENHLRFDVLRGFEFFRHNVLYSM